MSASLKVLVSGDVKGRFTQLLQRVKTVEKKAGAFDMLLCVGDFFGADDSDWEQYTSAKFKVAISTYILGANRPEHATHFPDLGGGELCENVTYLGRQGVYTTSAGLTIAYLSGLDATVAAATETCPAHFTVGDVNALRIPLTTESKFKGVDLLLTSPWPSGVEKYGSPVEGAIVAGATSRSSLVAQLALGLKPRYHFSGIEGINYERQPYRNHLVLRDAAQHVTRFIALADVGNPDKRKYLYALAVVPLKHMDTTELVKQPSDVTECPYRPDRSVFANKTTASRDDEKSSQFFFDPKSLERGSTSQRGGKRRSQGHFEDGPPQKRPVQPTGPCWFCLGSPEVEKHLVVSVGTHCYLTLAKGGLTPDHVLICPIGHHQSETSAPTDVLQELAQYKQAVSKYYAHEKKVSVFFERNYRTQHLQVQAVPVAERLMGSLKETFFACAERQNIELHEIPKHSDLKQIVPAGAPYFFAELPNDVKLLYRISKGFPLQFGREAVVHESLLNMPHRADWKSCIYSKEEETKMAAAFRQAFRDFDFTLA